MTTFDYIRLKANKKPKVIAQTAITVEAGKQLKYVLSNTLWFYASFVLDVVKALTRFKKCLKTEQ